MKPVIGIVLDHQMDGSFSDTPHYALRDQYFAAIERAGGSPVGLGYTDDTQSYFNFIDGLLSPGGNFAFPDEWYKDPGQKSLYKPSKRLAFDYAMVELALQDNVPFLGICAGMQVMAIVLKGQIIPDIHGGYDTTLAHKKYDKDKPAHNISIMKETALHKVTGREELVVNSWHNEAVIAPGNAIVAAKSADGIIEAIEAPNHPFALGLQWHPEVSYGKNDTDSLIFNAFIEAAQYYKNTL